LQPNAPNSAGRRSRGQRLRAQTTRHCVIRACKNYAVSGAALPVARPYEAPEKHRGAAFRQMDGGQEGSTRDASAGIGAPHATDESWHRSPVPGSVRRKANGLRVLLSGHQAVTHRAVSYNPARAPGSGLRDDALEIVGSPRAAIALRAADTEHLGVELLTPPPRQVPGLQGALGHLGTVHNRTVVNKPGSPC